MTRSRSLTPRWSNAAATLIARTLPVEVYANSSGRWECHDGSRALARARPAAPRRLRACERCGEVGPSNVLDVGRRPDGRPGRQAPALRLRPPGEPEQRPPDLLQGPRLAARLLDLQGGGRDHRRGAAHVPRV